MLCSQKQKKHLRDAAYQFAERRRVVPDQTITAPIAKIKPEGSGTWLSIATNDPAPFSNSYADLNNAKSA
jgi:hypothetical protein